MDAIIGWGNAPGSMIRIKSSGNAVADVLIRAEDGRMDAIIGWGNAPGSMMRYEVACGRWRWAGGAVAARAAQSKQRTAGPMGQKAAPTNRARAQHQRQEGCNIHRQCNRDA
jgi:fructose-1,6-bisphosphatase/sedoheptulose 1,7-bisphosphatase-like protein